MSTLQLAETPAVQSENSLGNTSSQWSVSTTKSTEINAECSVIKDDSNVSTPGCFSIFYYLLFSIFRRGKTSISQDNEQLLASLKYQTELIVEFLEGSLTSKFKLFGEQINFPDNVMLLEESEQFSLPTAQAWAATYLLKLCYEEKQRKQNSKTSVATDFVNLTVLRRSFLSICWEMHVMRQVVHEYQSELAKFCREMNKVMKRLQKALLSLSNKNMGSCNIHVSYTLNTKSHQDTNGKGKTNLGSVVATTHTSRPTYPFTLSIDQTNTNGITVGKNQDCSRLPTQVQEEIICGLFKSAEQSLESCQNLLESSCKRISGGGAILMGSSHTKEQLTCRRAVHIANNLVTKLSCSSRSAKLNESQTTQIVGLVSSVFDKWKEYLIYSQWVTLRIHELCDMITICYLSFESMNRNIPDLDRIKNEVNTKSKFQRNDKPISKDSNLKHYAIETLIEECNANSRTQLLNNSANMSQTHHDALMCTKYSQVVQACPLVFENGSYKYSIGLRTLPDLERVSSDMILLDRGDCSMDVFKKHLQLANIKFSINSPLKTFA